MLFRESLKNGYSIVFFPKTLDFRERICYNREEPKNDDGDSSFLQNGQRAGLGVSRCGVAKSEDPSRVAAGKGGAVRRSNGRRGLSRNRKRILADMQRWVVFSRYAKAGFFCFFAFSHPTVFLKKSCRERVSLPIAGLFFAPAADFGKSRKRAYLRPVFPAAFGTASRRGFR